jgi:hypothetical protein
MTFLSTAVMRRTCRALSAAASYLAVREIFAEILCESMRYD